MDNANKLDIIFSTILVGWSLTDIEHVINIVILVIQILYIGTRFAIDIYKKVKSKKIGEIPSVIEDFKESVEDLKEGLKNEQDDNTKSK